jgi:hypothetical protein
MRLLIIGFFIIISGICINGFEYKVTGTITDHLKKPVNGAVVKLLKANICDTTDAGGKFTIEFPLNDIIKTKGKDDKHTMQINRNSVKINLHSDKIVKIRSFNLAGQQLKSIFTGILKTGVHQFTLAPTLLHNLNIIECQIGDRVYIIKCINGILDVKNTLLKTESSDNRLYVKSAGVPAKDEPMDMLEVTHPLYTTHKYLLNPFKDSVVNFTIVAVNGNWITEFNQKYIDQTMFATSLKNGSYFVNGWIHSTEGDYDNSCFLVDSKGVVITKNFYGTVDNELGSFLEQQQDGTIRVFGDIMYRTDAQMSSLYSMNLSSNGDSLSKQIFSNKERINGACGFITRDQGYVIAGSRCFIDEKNRNNSVPHVIKINKDGTTTWEKEYVWPHYYSCIDDGIEMSDENIIIAGDSYNDSTRTYTVWVAKIDRNGKMVNSVIFDNKNRTYVLKISETNDKKLFLLSKEVKSDTSYRYIARISADCKLEWDTLINCSSKDIKCMTRLNSGTFLLAYSKMLTNGRDGEPVKEGIGLIQMKTDGTLVRESELYRYIGHPQAIATGKDGSIMIASEVDYTLTKQQFYLVNLKNEFE